MINKIERINRVAVIKTYVKTYVTIAITSIIGFVGLNIIFKAMHGISCIEYIINKL